MMEKLEKQATVQKNKSISQPPNSLRKGTQIFGKIDGITLYADWVPSVLDWEVFGIFLCHEIFAESFEID